MDRIKKPNYSIPGYVIGLAFRRAEERKERRIARTNALYALALCAIEPFRRFPLVGRVYTHLQNSTVPPSKTV